MLLVVFEDVLEQLISQDILGDAVKATFLKFILFIVDPDPVTIDYEIEAYKLFAFPIFVIHQPELDVEVLSVLVLDSAA